MSWIDDDDYFGPDRRRARALRIIERRQPGGAAPAPPSLATLLRKLRVWASGAAGDGADGIDRYRARVRTVAKLADERGEAGVARELRRLDQELEAAQLRGDRGAGELSNDGLQRAVAALR